MRTVGTLVFLGLLVVPAVICWFQHEKIVENAGATAKLTEFGLPMLMAFFFYTTIISPKRENYLNFSEPEIGFLFPAPFMRRQLLQYKFLSIMSATFWISFFTATGAAMFLVRENFWFSMFSAFVGLFFTFLFVQMFMTLMGLVGTSVKVRLYNPARKVIAVVASVLTLLTLFSVRGQLTWDRLKFIQNPQDLIPIVDGYVNSTAGKILLGPFKIFSNVILSETLGAFALWGALCLLVNFAIGYLIIRLDANYLEISVLASQRRTEAFKKQNVETLFLSSNVGTLPMLPFFRGAGPIAWRQLQTFYRTWKVGIFYFLLVLFMMGAIVWMGKKVNSAERFWMVVSFLGLISYVGAVALPIGFQADVRRMDILKSLPASSRQIAVGQILGPTIVLTIIQYLYILIFAFTALDQWANWLILLGTVPLINFLILSISNTMALVFPSRGEPSAANQFENLGSTLIFTFTTSFTVVTLVLLITALSAVCYWLTSSLIVAVLAGWLVLLAACATGIFFASMAFEMFDVSKV